MKLTHKEAARVQAMSPQARENYIFKRTIGGRASHPGKPRSYWDRRTIPKHLRSQFTVG